MNKKLIGEEQQAGQFDGPIELLTIKDVAELMKVSASSIRRLQSDRHLPFIKVGGSVRFLKSDILEYLKKGRIDAIH